MKQSDNNKTSLKDVNTKSISFKRKLKWNLSLSLFSYLIQKQVGIKPKKILSGWGSLLKYSPVSRLSESSLNPFQIPTQWNLESWTRPRLQLQQHLGSDVPDNTLSYYTVKLHEKKNWRINSCYICTPFNILTKRYLTIQDQKLHSLFSCFKLWNTYTLNWMKILLLLLCILESKAPQTLFSTCRSVLVSV